jgi:hypothetical protein
VHALGKDHEPSLLVFFRREESAADAMGRPVPLRRVATFSVIAEVTKATAIDDTLDQIAAEVEAAMGADLTLGGKARDSELQLTESAYDGGGETPIGQYRMDFAVEYRTQQNDPQTINN